MEEGFGGLAARLFRSDAASLSFAFRGLRRWGTGPSGVATRAVRGGGEHAAPCGSGGCAAVTGLARPSEEPVCPLLQWGRRRGRLLIAGETVHNVGRDRGPAREL